VFFGRRKWNRKRNSVGLYPFVSAPISPRTKQWLHWFHGAKNASASMSHIS